MKNLFLILSLCFIFFSCFEKEEEVTVVAEEPKEGNVMECEKIIRFIEESLIVPVDSNEVKAAIKKYRFRNKNVYWLYPGSYTHDAGIVIDSNCNTICEWVLVGDTGCSDWSGNTQYIETIWQDPR